MDDIHSFEIKDLNAGYDGKMILNDVSISIPIGKVTVILGSNGCGKSTLLKTIARLIPRSSGDVLLNDKEILSYKPKMLARQIGLLPQSPIVPEGVAVSDLVSRGRFPYQSSFGGLSEKDYEAVGEALDMMGVTALSDRCADELSGGQRQRVWIAMAIAQQTGILLLDEPTTYLDVAYQIEILEKLRELNQKSGITIVMVLHDINLSARYADNIITLKNGRVEAAGSPHDIITAESIRHIYELDSVIINDPIYNTPMVVPKGHSKQIKTEETS